MKLKFENEYSHDETQSIALLEPELDFYDEDSQDLFVKDREPAYATVETCCYEDSDSGFDESHGAFFI